MLNGLRLVQFTYVSSPYDRNPLNSRWTKGMEWNRGTVRVRRTVRRNQPYGTGTKRLARTFIPMFHSLHSLRFRLFIPFIHMVHSLSPRNNRNKETGVKVKGREWTMRNWTEQTSDSGQVLRVLGSFNTLHSFHFIIRMRTGVSHTHEQLEQEGEGRTNWNNWTVHHSYVPFAYCVPLVHFIHSFPHSSLCL